MAEFQFANNAFAVVADSEVGTGATTINVTSDSTLPDLEAGKTVRVTGVQLDSSGNAQALEIMTLTAVDSNGTQLTVTRAQEGTTAIMLYAGDRIELRLTAAGLNNMAQTGKPQTFSAEQTFSETKETVYNLTGTVIDPANGAIQYKTLSANTTFTESLDSGQGVTLRISGGATYTVTWPTMTWVGGSAPTLTANDVVVIWQEQTTVYGLYVGSVA